MKKLLMVLPMALSLSSLPVMANENDTWIPKEYVAYCEEIGAKYHVCPELLEAIMEAESSGKKYARNGSCVGLMQINMNYAPERMAKLGVEDAYDPYGNIELACDILVELYETYGEDTYEALTRYNGWADVARRKREQDWPYYARHIVERSYRLEEIHGKHDYSGYKDFF